MTDAPAINVHLVINQEDVDSPAAIRAALMSLLAPEDTVRGDILVEEEGYQYQVTISFTPTDKNGDLQAIDIDDYLENVEDVLPIDEAEFSFDD